MTKFTLKIETDSLSDLYAYSNAIDTRSAIANLVEYIDKCCDGSLSDLQYTTILEQLQTVLRQAGG